VTNAQALAAGLAEEGFRIVSGGTDNHLMLVDLRPFGVTGKVAQEALDAAGITCNKNAIPNDPEKPMVTSGVRIGSPAMTTRGFRKPEAEQLANLIADALERPGDDANLARVADAVKALCARFPVYA
jgi:glycine hydroxymethyltransferase